MCNLASKCLIGFSELGCNHLNITEWQQGATPFNSSRHQVAVWVWKPISSEIIGINISLLLAWFDGALVKIPRKNV